MRIRAIISQRPTRLSTVRIMGIISLALGLVLGAVLSPSVLFAKASTTYIPEFEKPPTQAIPLFTPTKITVALTAASRRTLVSGVKVTLGSDSLSENSLTINGKTPGQTVTVTARNGLATFTVEAVYHTGPVRLTAAWDGPQGPSHPVVTFVTAGRGNPPTETRFAGNTRFGTAAQLAQASNPSGAGTVIFSSGLDSDLVDALTASPLSALLKAPILLTQSNQEIGVDPLHALATLHASHVILIGAVDNPEIRAELPSSIRVRGYAGSNRYQTALAVARAMVRDGGTRSTLFFSSGANANLTDALTIDPVAVKMHAPVLLLPPKGPLPEGYRSLMHSASTIYVVGAATSYPQHLPRKIALAGVNRFATAALVNQRFFPRPMGVVITNADGAHLVDALTAGPLAGERSLPIVMVSSNVIPGPTYDYLAEVSDGISGVYIAGGPDAVSPLMANAVGQMMR